MNIQNFKAEHESLMKKWEKECREWLIQENADENLVTFFKDGVIDPNVWFDKDFRPLFILKEVHDKEKKEPNIDFVSMTEGDDYDIWKRKGMWRAFGALARGIIYNIENEDIVLPYEEVYEENIEKYRDTLRQIAIINIKKISGGNKEDSEESKKTKHYVCHACKFESNLKKQIELMKPTVIICCGVGMEQCFEIKEGKIYGIPAVMGLHPATNANLRREKFYTNTIKNVRMTVIKQ